MPDAIRPDGHGHYRLNLDADEREALARVPELIREAMTSTDTRDPGYRRMFPPAYDDDPERNESFAASTHGDLEKKRLADAAIMQGTLDADRISDEEIRAWLDVCNDARLLLGSRLAITESTTRADVEPEQLGDYALYLFLSYLVGRMVVASGGPEEDSLRSQILRRAARERAEGPGG